MSTVMRTAHGTASAPTTAPLDTAALVAAVDDELTTACLVLADIRIRRTVRRHEVDRLRVVAERINAAVDLLEVRRHAR